mmetsp:Transcript_73969/g.145159  ORF Transcript_73969/g.145159 Transcript_73969/m.145159 type:complete len:208 (-) Transcript_73969:82-705(-)
MQLCGMSSSDSQPVLSLSDSSVRGGTELCFSRRKVWYRVMEWPVALRPTSRNLSRDKPKPLEEEELTGEHLLSMTVSSGRSSSLRLFDSEERPPSSRSDEDERSSESVPGVESKFGAEGTVARRFFFLRRRAFLSDAECTFNDDGGVSGTGGVEASFNDDGRQGLLCTGETTAGLPPVSAGAPQASCSAARSSISRASLRSTSRSCS